MPAVKRPIRGSRGFYPKKRAKRIYPRIKSWPSFAEARPLGFAGYKAGMTHAMLVDTNPNSRTKGQLVSRAVTILDCPPLSIFGFRAYRKSAADRTPFCDVFTKTGKNLDRKVGLGKTKTEENMKKIENHIDQIGAINLMCHTNPFFKKMPEVFEIKLGGDAKTQLEFAKGLLGKEMKIAEVFKDGDFVDVVSVSKGKGFEGVVKRFGVRILGRKFQQMARKIGAHGQTEPGKVRQSIPQSGQLGMQTRTELNKKLIKVMKAEEVNPKGGFLRYGNVKGDAVVIDGSIPGPAKRLIRLRMPIRPRNVKHPSEIRYLSRESKQGV